MGLIDDLDSMELDDSVKEKIRQAHQSEIEEKDGEVQRLRREQDRDEVEKEVKDLGNMGFGEAPGLLKFVRQVFLSDDKEAGTVLLTDADLSLSGDDAVGARQREEISTADTLRRFIELMPKKEEDGKLKVALSDQGIAAEGDDPPPSGDDPTPEEAKEQSRKRAETALGRTVPQRSRKRYRNDGVEAVTA